MIVIAHYKGDIIVIMLVLSSTLDVYSNNDIIRVYGL